MCGILGNIHKSSSSWSPLAESDLSKLSHRGPDGSGVFTNEHIQFGHVRLAIIDLTDAGKQPMSSPDGRFVVTFNGEIYNHLELRVELEFQGERFSTQSDTEVLLAAYKVWGRDCVRHFRGMFAFALWDSVEKTVFLARDRCGEKPLFYHFDGECFSFASELKALIPLLKSPPPLDPSVVDMYLHYQYVPEPFTLLSGVHKLPAGHTLFLSLSDWNARLERYWDVENTHYEGSLPKDSAEILSCIRDGLEDAVKMTLRADVPVAVALSGGVDSGAIAALAQKNYKEPMHAFCVGYPGRPPYDERHQARALAESLGMIVHEVELPVESFIDFFPQLVRIMDEPIADPAAFGHYSVPEAAAREGIKVLLTGIGGDELFWGYGWVNQSVLANEFLGQRPWLSALANPGMEKILNRAAKSSRLPKTVRSWADRMGGLADTHTPPDQLRFYMGAPDFGEAFDLKETVSGPALRDLDSRNPFLPTENPKPTIEKIPQAIIKMLFDTWLVSNAVTLGDRVSMGVGVEARLPFLDFKLIELVMALRTQNPDHRLGQKAWLRAALKGTLPEEVLVRPKAGFQPPVHDWLSGVVNTYGDVLLEGVLVQQRILDKDKVPRAVSELRQRGWPGLFFAYKLVLLEMWYRKVVAS